MDTQTKELLAEVEAYYSSKIKAYGETPQGVDWNGEASQEVRFEQLTKLVDLNARFSLNDLGCGYGALVNFLQKKYQSFEYVGSDVSLDMIIAARKRFDGIPYVHFDVGSTPSIQADYSIASGIFNVRMGRTNEQWWAYLCEMLDLLDKSSSKGFAFNCLTSYSDPEKMRDYLYYANPLELFDLCKRKYSRNVALLHDYGLYEFTLIVKKLQ
jgi:SAM-dependent methyltransferase